VRLPSEPVFDVALLLADVREMRAFLLPRLRGARIISEQTGIPLSTVELHLRPSTSQRAMTVDHAMRWMLWLGKYDIREYEYRKEVDDAEGEL
jgi:hypothetical protein